MRDIRKKGWFWVDNSLIDRDDLNPYEKLLYMALARYCDGDGKCFPSMETLMKSTGVNSKSTIVKYLKNLESKGLIFVLRKTGESNIYFLKNADAKNESDTSTRDGLPPVHVVYPKETQLKKHNKKTKEKYKKEKPKMETIKNHIDTLEIDEERKEIFKEWIDYKHERKEDYSSTKSVDKLVKMLSKHNTEYLRKIVDHSIMRNWQGIIEPEDWKKKSKEIIPKVNAGADYAREVAEFYGR